MSQPAYVPGDALPLAPALAPRGPHPVGVTTLRFSHPYQLDVLGSLAAGELRRNTRELVADAWYPAVHGGWDDYLDHLEGPLSAPGDEPRPATWPYPQPFRFRGRAARDAQPLRSIGPCPLVVVSHGYTGSRYLLSWLGENLASKGYAVIALDHTDSTHTDRADVLSSLRNRPLDIALALRLAADLERHHPLLHHVWDAGRALLVGYSMGGYGVLLALGAGFDAQGLDDPFFQHPVQRELLADLCLDQPFFEDLSDAVAARVKAAALLAPWGGSRIWTDESLARLRTPLFLAAGSADQVADYTAVRRIFEASRHSDRWLLTFEHAGHNVGNNHPPAALLNGDPTDWQRYADPVWDVRRITELLQHHLTAFFGWQARGLPLASYLAGAASAAAAEPWPGFPPGTTAGLRLEHLKPQA